MIEIGDKFNKMLDSSPTGYSKMTCWQWHSQGPGQARACPTSE